MKTYNYKSIHFGFQMSIPNDWSDSTIIDSIDNLTHPKSYQGDSSRKKSASRTIVGTNGKYLNILITPLLENESEPTIEYTEKFFEGLSYRQNLNVIKTGTIIIANKEHFWATYCRGFLMSIVTGGQMQFFKKYCIYLNRAEYLLTAGLYSVNAGEKLSTDQDLNDSEKVFDEIVSSMKFGNA